MEKIGFIPNRFIKGGFFKRYSLTISMRIQKIFLQKKPFLFRSVTATKD